MTDFTPVPLILDSTVLHELARGEFGTISLIQGYDADGQPMVVSALAITRALVDTHTEEATDAMHGLTSLEYVTVAPLRDTEQAELLAEVVVTTGLEVYEAHTAAIADISVCPILTMDASRWIDASTRLDEPLHIIEIRDPEG
ncbi:hypothetical protein Acor_55240 [Acrocarpospora corrugata]|uniref:PIN domain-containing protein n=1 Tax=Acrocarpospora corrugata TaxID=35763 RepID=A0A5M3WAC5_9ACTN|nr:hypothetical protein [Acrocarpospora corrugata]GES03458.1 hypothetical protein Acor_55240 [Acrocarpospora corrugata]